MKQNRPYIYLDIDNTLVNTTPTIIKRLERLMKTYTIKEGLMYVYNLLPLSDRDKRLGAKYHFAREFWAEYEKLRVLISPEPIGDVKSKLAKWASEGFRLGIISNGAYAGSIQKISLCGLRESDFPGGILTGEGGSYKKPDRRVIDSLGLKNLEKVSYIGDSSEDHVFSQNSGMKFKAVCTGFFERADFIRAGVKKRDIFDTLEDVKIDGLS
jgi:FMN phosphatase YigB (HAD superfamily)